MKASTKEPARTEEVFSFFGWEAIFSIITVFYPKDSFQKTREKSSMKPVQMFCKCKWFCVASPGWGVPHYTSRILLQSWDGFKWEDRNVFSGLGQAGQE